MRFGLVAGSSSESLRPQGAELCNAADVQQHPSRLQGALSIGKGSSWSRPESSRPNTSRTWGANLVEPARIRDFGRYSVFSVTFRAEMHHDGDGIEEREKDCW